MLLPEIGGRVQMASTRPTATTSSTTTASSSPPWSADRPLISGGIEFNWPQHRPAPSTGRVPHRENADGSWTVWFSEIERMFRTKGMVGFTLYPDRAYLELSVSYNRTTCRRPSCGGPPCRARQRRLPVRFPAGRPRRDGPRQARRVRLPIATGTYYKVNYAPGTASPATTSPSRLYMAYHLTLTSSAATITGAGGHDAPPTTTLYRAKAVDRGNGDFGQAWDRQSPTRTALISS